MTELKERDERGGYIVPWPWWKAIYDTKTPTWRAYGRLAFVQAPTEEAAKAAALLAAQAEYPGAEILPVAIGMSTPDAAEAFAEKRRRLAEWQANVKVGIPNTRATLEPSSPSSSAALTSLRQQVETLTQERDAIVAVMDARIPLPQGETKPLPQRIDDELSDYLGILDEVSEVYCEVTCSRISKPNTAARHVIGEVQSLEQDHIDEAVKEATEELKQQLASLAAAQERMTWQPIETAPKDEQRVLLFNPDEAMGLWAIQAGAYYEQLGDWQYDNQNPRYSNAHPPTQWMPLPALPSLAASSRETTNETKDDDTRQSSPSPVRTTGSPRSQPDGSEQA